MSLSPIEYISSQPRRKKKSVPLFCKLLIALALCLGGFAAYRVAAPHVLAEEPRRTHTYRLQDLVELEESKGTTHGAFIAAALKRTQQSVIYDPAYYEIPYPMGDIPASKGVCTDVVIRSYREIGIDLQELIHEEMSAYFPQYPKTWGLKRPDRNIDHRRVPNLQTFFSRNGQSLVISQDPRDYQPGDLVVWRLSHGAPHIGIVVPAPSAQSATPYIVHNVGAGPQWEDNLFRYEIVGHYRYGVD